MTEGAERDRLWETQKTRMPGFADYERKTSRVIPVIALDACPSRTPVGAFLAVASQSGQLASRRNSRASAARATDWDGSLDEYDDPLWIRVLAFALAAAVAVFGAVGLFLAVLGWYRLWLVLVVGTLVFAGLVLLARPLLPTRGNVSRAAHVTAALAVVAISLITMWNVSNASQQVLIIRDGGTYLNAGKWIASHGTLEVKPFAGPFTPTSGLAVSSAGMNRQGDHLDFTLEHMFPALLAEAQGIGGDHLMFATNALLGGIVLLGFYLLAAPRAPEPARGARRGVVPRGPDAPGRVFA